MDLVKIYGCLCDRTRLRILNLLLDGPLCVCHFQRILREPQVKISKHLAYLRKNALVEARREANRVIYRLPARQPLALKSNLACLQDCAREEPAFREDFARLKKVRDGFDCDTPAAVRKSRGCC
jgi:ArsR family transcriptional regulator